MFNKLIQLIGLFFFAFAIWLIAKEVEHVGLEHLKELILKTPVWAILLALLFTFFDFIALYGYDALALDYIGKKLPFRTVLKASCIGFAISNTAGHSYASGGAVRYLFYIPAGLSQLEVVKIIAFETVMFFIGMGSIYILAVGFMFFDPSFAHYEHQVALYASAGGLVVLFFIYYYYFVAPERSFKMHGVEIKAPTRNQTIGQILIGLADNFLVFLVFYVILRSYLDVSFVSVFIAFTIAQVIGITTQIPGGVGVLAGIFLYLFPHAAHQKGEILAALIVFRVLYYFVPFILAMVFFSIVKLYRYFIEHKSQV